ncbi:MAG: spondin domain-containing protein [Pseudomonadales bacterium]|nr:spondin domain-containing protein [Pseudomonadales bacterium]
MKTSHIAASALAISALLPVTASAQDLTVQITNLTHGIHFTPLLVAAHEAPTHLFQAGQSASANLQAMAEGGDLTGLEVDAIAANATYVANPAVGLLAPGMSVSTMLDTTGTSNRYLSVVGMMLPTNDGFVGLDSIAIPSAPGTYTFHLNAYDAGTEANDEIINGGGMPNTAGIPVAPGGDGGSGAMGAAGVDSNTMVHIHRGVLGDTDASGGNSDLDSRIHRWLNPVAKLVLTVQ